MRAPLAGTVTVVVALLAGPDSARAGGCGCLGFRQPTTFRMKAADNNVVVYGRLVNARKPRLGDEKDRGSTDLVILRVIRTVLALGREKRVQLPYEMLTSDKPVLLFATLSGGKLRHDTGCDATPAVVDYLKDLLAIGGKDRVKVLRYCFDYLDHPDPAIAQDAYVEFITATDRQLRQVAKQLPGARLRRWLQSPSVTRQQFRLSSILLGHCGGELDGALLRELLEKDTWREDLLVLDGLLSAYVQLRPREGWAYLRGLLAPSRSFAQRYAAFRSMTSLDTHRSGGTSKKDVLAALGLVLEDPDLADFAVEHLRARRYWELTGRVLSLPTRQSHDIPVIHRNVLRYALQCPAPKARQFVEAVRQRDPERVSDQEELLKLEAQPETPRR